MNTEQAYDQWAGQYDTNRNRTRDLEAVALRCSVLKDVRSHPLPGVLAAARARTRNGSLRIAATSPPWTSVRRCLLRAKEKVTSDSVRFVLQADISRPWSFAEGTL